MNTFQMPPPDMAMAADKDYIVSYIEALRRELEVAFAYLDSFCGKQADVEKKTDSEGSILISGSDTLENESKSFYVDKDGSTIKNGRVVFDSEGIKTLNSRGNRFGFCLEDGDLLLYNNGKLQASIYLSGSKLCIDGDVYLNGTAL